MLCPHTHQKMKEVNSKTIKCVSLGIKNKKELKGTKLYDRPFHKVIFG
jgi:hypothetical protein